MADTQDDSQQQPEVTPEQSLTAPEPDVAAGAAPEPDVAAGAAPEPDVAAGAAPEPDVAAGAAPEIQPAPERPLVEPRTDITVAEMREWLRNWIANATGQSADAVNDATPMVELGLSSRDAVAMASDIEDLTGVTLTATVLFRHPTIESLATVIIEGEPEPEDSGDEDWSRASDVEDIAIVGVATRFPGDMNSPDEMWEALLEGRDAITDLPEGRWEEFLDEPRLAERVAQAHARGGYLKDI